MNQIEQAARALATGGLVVCATDTVYGLCASPHDPAALEQVNELKGRAGQPLALLAASLEQLVSYLPELDERRRSALEALLPGPYTIVLPNPENRLPSLSPGREGTIGIRVPDLPASTRALVEAFGALAATSANRHGEPDPRRVREIPGEIASAVAVVLDEGELPGVPSTVIDLSGSEAVVLREGAGNAELAIAVARVALGL